MQRPFVLIDVGARKGFEHHWEEFKDQIERIGFEPNDQSYKECIETKIVPGGKYYPFALDIAPGRRRLFITRYLSATSFLRPKREIVDRYGYGDLLSVVDEIDVETIDLDSFCNSNEINYVDFVKIDAEGAELDILKGAQQILEEKVLGLSIEVGFLEIREGQPSFGEIDEFLRRLGFYLFDLDLNRWVKSADRARPTSEGGKGQLIFGQALYLRDPVQSVSRENEFGPEWDPINILKLASIFEIFGLNDCAIELIDHYTKVSILDKKNSRKYVNLLTRKDDRVRQALGNILRGIGRCITK